MSGNKMVAKSLMDKATNLITADRNDTHGDTEASFNMIAEFWTTYLSHRFLDESEIKVTPTDVSQMMALLKKARATYGDPHNPDNFTDDLGYTALAGMFQLPNKEIQ